HGLERACELVEDAQGTPLREVAPALEGLAQVVAVDVLDDHVAAVVGGPAVGDEARDVVVREPGERLGLALEAAPDAGVGGLVHELDDDEAAELAVARE